MFTFGIYYFIVIIILKGEKTMGKPGVPVYGNEDLGSAIESAEKIIAKIKTNKYSKEDLLELVEVNQTILKYLIKDEN